MPRARRYLFEIVLIVAAILICAAGFWNIYFGPKANPQPHHHLHLATVFLWIGLLLAQLILIARGRYQIHRKVGLAVLVAGPLLVATTAMLAVRSAHKGLVSGEGDFMIVQNTMTTLELGLLIFLAFLLKSRRKLHGALLMSTTILFIGIALFFALTSFVPPFKAVAFDPTFEGFRLAGTAGQVTCLAVGLVFYVRDQSNGWPYLAAGSCFALNDVIFSLLTNFDLIDPLTRGVGSIGRPFAYAAIFALMLALLAATALPTARRPRPA